jgi:hypothetical protein
MTHEPLLRTGADAETVRELVALGIDSPKKLDLVAALGRSREGSLGLDALVAACGGTARDLAAALEELRDARVVEAARFYNLTEYALAADERVRRAASRPPGETRRLRLALLAHALASA